MPLVQLTCPYCTGQFQADDALVGQAVGCPVCGGVVTLAGTGPPDFPPPPDMVPPPFDLFEQPPVCPPPPDLVEPTPLPPPPEFVEPMAWPQGQGGGREPRHDGEVPAPQPAQPILAPLPPDPGLVSPAAEEQSAPVTGQPKVLAAEPARAAQAAETASPNRAACPAPSSVPAADDGTIAVDTSERPMMVGSGLEAREVRVLSVEERDRRRGVRNLVLMLLGIAILAGIMMYLVNR